MPRENSFSDEGGRSLTPDLELPEASASQPQASTVEALPIPQAQPPVIGIETSVLNSTARSASPNSSQPPIRASFGGVTSPIDKFRSSVQKVIRLHRTSTIIADLGGVGAEPGIDPRRDSAYLNYGHINQDCLIEVVDYSTVRSSFGRMTNRSFVEMMSHEGASQKEPWVKVRWINIGGISWDVLSALAIKFDLHPLALEDVLHQRGHARSKADYYHKHLFIRILCHALSHRDEGSPDLADLQIPRSTSPVPLNDEKVVDIGSEADEGSTALRESAPSSRFYAAKALVKRRPWHTMFGRNVENTPGKDNSLIPLVPRRFTKARRKRVQQKKTIEELKKGERVDVKISPMSIFLLRDGTVISIHPTPNLEYTSPITNRLRHRDTGLRTSADPSLLVESLLDLVVDSALEVIDDYHAKILKMEHDILLRPKMTTVRHLHILSGDLILHKRTLAPIKTLIYSLRRYDLDRCAALVDPGSAAKVEGFMSHKAKIYLADVHDHMEYILTSLDMFASISENLINFTFNMISNDMNDVMRRLTLATIIFLPLTLLTGYFGMNFTFMWSIMHNHSDILFWEIAIPLMAVIIPSFLYGDLVRMVHYIQKKILVKKAQQAYQ